MALRAALGLINFVSDSHQSDIIDRVRGSLTVNVLLVLSIFISIKVKAMGKRH